MADTVLDYGNPDGGEEMDATYENNPIIDPREAQLQDASMDAEMQQWEEGFQGTEEEFENERKKKVEELLAARPNSTARFYALPPDQAIEAGAKRGISALPALAEEELMGIEGEYGERDNISINSILSLILLLLIHRKCSRSRSPRYNRKGS